jgi:hypothetical protein
MHELHEVLLGREALQNFLAERVLLDALDEVADDGDVDVGLEERETDVAQRLLDVLLRDLPLTLELRTSPPLWKKGPYCSGFGLSRKHRPHEKKSPRTNGVRGLRPKGRDVV